MSMSTIETSNRRVALISGAGNGLGAALAKTLAGRGVGLYLLDVSARAEALASVEALVRADGGVVLGCATHAAREPAAAIAEAARVAGRIDYFVDFCVPTADWQVEELAAYPLELLRRALAAAEYLVAAPERGSMVLHTFLPTLYADSRFDEVFPMVKGGIVGVTRTLCRRFGARGLVSNCVHTGLVDLPEAKALAKERVLALKPPIGRWVTPAEVAQLVTFLLLKKGYLTGQSVVFDGGMTSGISGI
jgi:3-oxoacyl-[acyl-carrier protein] reductase